MASAFAFPGHEGKAALFGDLFSVLLAPYDDNGAFAGRFRVAVPRMGVGEKAAQTLALVIHELATNSLKYGALSADAGAIDVSSSSDDERVTVVWAETGGPAVDQDRPMSGFGSKMLARSLTDQLGGAIAYDWQPAGLVVTLHLRKDRLSA